jgi:hypothetical protein
MASAKEDTKDSSAQWKNDKAKKAQTFAAAASSNQKDDSSSDEEEYDKEKRILKIFTKRQEIAEE